MRARAARSLGLAAAVSLAGCSLPGLTSVELFGAGPGGQDAAPDADLPADADLGGADGGAGSPDLPAGCPVDPGAPATSGINGSVLDSCRRPVTALVGVTGQGNNVRTCSLGGKGGWQLRGLHPGCHLTLAAYRPGFKEATRDVTILPGNVNPSFEILLEPQVPVSCSQPAPPDTYECSCATLPGCQP